MALAYPLGFGFGKTLEGIVQFQGLRVALDAPGENGRVDLGNVGYPDHVENWCGTSHRRYIRHAIGMFEDVKDQLDREV